MARLLTPQWASCLRRSALSNSILGPGSIPLRSFGRFTVPAAKSIDSMTLCGSKPFRNMSTTAISRPTASLTASTNFFTPRKLATTASAFVETDGKPEVKQNNTLPPPEEPVGGPVLSPPVVGHWLIGCAGLVFAIVVVGGITRLTESGLSIVEWRPITGILPPLSEAEWEEEFTKYKATPEFKILNHRITIEEFKQIFFWEYAHRVLGRIIGLAFVLPLAYFIVRKRVPRSMFLPGLTRSQLGLPASAPAPNPLPLPTLTPYLGGLALLIGAQGALGWYMVKSGLAESLLTTPGAVPRVSQYRLAAHLGCALALYVGMLGGGIAVIRDWNWAHGKAKGIEALEKALQNNAVKVFKARVGVLGALVFLTALSGAFVAGLDAGLVYNEFPTMGGRLAPPRAELMNPAYAQKEDKSDLWWRNMLENPSTVQFNHRVLAVTTYLSTALVFAHSRRSAVRQLLPAQTKRLAALAFGLANIQVALGITTLLYLVPVPLAASHQAGSVALLTAVVALAASLRKPGRAARFWKLATQRNQNTSFVKASQL
ncbi:Electron transfer protein 1, mitochondrial OS=Schizosaccharomyces pombe (strain 972 / ATCC 24843) GN=etp1 PE=1 SV=2 [Rhizoctonia solani AG-1 IB]|uniref:Electron transfer protein 1, mitochondrial n=1 Tax=Thanatephorus cucumeris (strain AG1-IB / isolate 7/3/14) TaxID=1108050 RepID=A0A0B7FNQ2_THACB|nr:Electron transfer protein 1, mitochondrial OS=Schizosaccharomyces pombe (strain 972 / ATCC 24843) GN=etp1 PE=1 SV=2 [Rhizoctonia solani AG-1 IB]